LDERIKEIRDYFSLSRAAFGEKIGVTGDAINNWERGRAEVKEYFIKLLCSAYNVSEVWLRYGKGDMFTENKQDILQQLKEEYNLTNMEYAIIENYLNLSIKQRESVVEFLNNLINPQPTPTVKVAARGNASLEIPSDDEADKADIENYKPPTDI